MRWRTFLLPAIGATLLLSAAALCAIYEYAGAEGKAKFYKYTDKHGVVVFTDRLTAIPEEYRKKNRIVKAGPPSRPAAPAAAPAQAAPEAPAVPPLLRNRTITARPKQRPGTVPVFWRKPCAAIWVRGTSCPPLKCANRSEGSTRRHATTCEPATPCAPGNCTCIWPTTRGRRSCSKRPGTSGGRRNFMKRSS